MPTRNAAYANRSRAKSGPVAVAALALTLFLIALAFLWDDSRRVELRIVGGETIVFNWSEDSCEHRQVPDVPARAFRDDRGRTHLIAFNYLGHRMIGATLEQLAPDCSPVISSHDHSDPAQFDGREWLHSVYSPDGRKVFALIHNEHHGHRHPGQCPSGEPRRCWYNSITLAVSENGGSTYAHAASPHHLVAAITERYRPDLGPAGAFNPSNIIFRREDRHFYAIFRYIPYSGAARIGLMRTTRLEDPKSWRAWDGKSFSLRFENPYQSESLSDAAGIPAPIAPNEIGGMFASLTYNDYLERYLLVGTFQGYDPRLGRSATGIYFSLSRDLIHWTPRRLIFEIERPSSWVAGDPDPIAFPSALDPQSPSRNFETTGKRFYLFFTRFNFGDSEEFFDRDLVRVPVEFQQAEASGFALLRHWSPH